MERGGGQSDQRQHRLSDQPQETACIPTDRVPCERNELGLEELLSYSEHEVTISEAINGIWLCDSHYKPIRAKPPRGWRATAWACFLAGTGELITGDAPGNMSEVG